MVKKIPVRECHLEDEPFSVAITNIFARESFVAVQHLYEK
jgi:hypothetical protein